MSGDEKMLISMRLDFRLLVALLLAEEVVNLYLLSKTER